MGLAINLHIGVIKGVIHANTVADLVGGECMESVENVEAQTYSTTAVNGCYA